MREASGTGSASDFRNVRPSEGIFEVIRRNQIMRGRDEPCEELVRRDDARRAGGDRCGRKAGGGEAGQVGRWRRERGRPVHGRVAARIVRRRRVGAEGRAVGPTERDVARIRKSCVDPVGRTGRQKNGSAFEGCIRHSGRIGALQGGGAAGGLLRMALLSPPSSPSPPEPSPSSYSPTCSSARSRYAGARCLCRRKGAKGL